MCVFGWFSLSLRTPQCLRNVVWRVCARDVGVLLKIKRDVATRRFRHCRLLWRAPTCGEEDAESRSDSALRLLLLRGVAAVWHFKEHAPCGMKKILYKSNSLSSACIKNVRTMPPTRSNSIKTRADQMYHRPFCPAQRCVKTPLCDTSYRF